MGGCLHGLLQFLGHLLDDGRWRVLWCEQAVPGRHLITRQAASAAVGRSGNAATRFGAATASARNCPARIGAADEPMPSNTTGT